MELFDVSQGIVHGMPVWPGDPVVEVNLVTEVRAGDVANVSELRLGTHTGTHVDPPAHFFDGAATADALPLDALIGNALVVDVTGAGPLGSRELEATGAGPGVVRLLLRTGGWPEGEDRPALGLSAAGAKWVVQRGIRLVGIDTPSIEASAARAACGGSPGERSSRAPGETGEAGAEGGHPVHEILLTAGVVVLEGLVLSSVPPGRYELVCLPLKVVGGDGAPARAVLVRR